MGARHKNRMMVHASDGSPRLFANVAATPSDDTTRVAESESEYVRDEGGKLRSPFAKGRRRCSVVAAQRAFVVQLWRRARARCYIGNALPIRARLQKALVDATPTMFPWHRREVLVWCPSWNVLSPNERWYQCTRNGERREV